MEISLVFSNIVINCSKGKHFLLLLWINFTTYAILQKLHHYLNQKEATKIVKNNLYKKSLHCFIEPPVVTSHIKFCLSTVNKFKVISLLRQQLFVHILLSHGSRCYLSIQSYHFISQTSVWSFINNIIVRLHLITSAPP